MRKERFSSFLPFLQGVGEEERVGEEEEEERKVCTRRLDEGSYVDRDRPRMLAVRSVLEEALSPETNP